MSRQRFIYPEMWNESDDIQALSMGARLLFIGLFSTADDYGRGKGAPAVLRSRIFPADKITNEDVEAWCTEVAARKMAIFYRVDGTVFYQVANWSKYQNPKYKGTDRLPQSKQADDYLYGSDPGRAPGRVRPEPARNQPGTRAMGGEGRGSRGVGLGGVGCGVEGSWEGKATGPTDASGLHPLDPKAPDPEPRPQTPRRALTPDEQARADEIRDRTAAIRAKLGMPPPDPETDESDEPDEPEPDPAAGDLAAFGDLP